MDKSHRLTLQGYRLSLGFLVLILALCLTSLSLGKARASSKAAGQTASGSWFIIDARGYVHTYTSNPPYGWSVQTNGTLYITNSKGANIASFAAGQWVSVEPYGTSVTPLPLAK